MKKVLFILLLLASYHISCQTNIDSLLEALPEAKDTLRLQAIDEILTKVRSTDKELAQRLINEEYELASNINIEKFTAGVHNAHAIFKYFQNDLDSSIYYFEKSLSSFQKIGNKSREAFLNNNIGILYETKGDFETSIKYHLASLKIKEELEDLQGIANSKVNMANVWVELGDYSKAKGIYKEALLIYQELDNLNNANDVTFNLASIASNEDSTALSIQYYNRALQHYQSIDDEYSVLECYSNMGQAYYELDQLDSALYFYNQALPLAIDFEDLEQQASLNRHMGDTYSRQGLHSRAIPLLNRSVDIFKSLGYKDQLTDSYQFLYEAQENAGQYKAVYNNMHNYVLLRDSIASKKMQTDIVELETKYETEKKEKELFIQKANNEKKQSRIYLLATGLISLLLLSSALYYAMRQKVKRNKIEKEKVDLELKEAEQQLEFKKKELLAKVLQLSKKNEFLHTLEQEVDQLKSTLGNSVSKSTDRINRMITNDAIDEEEWDQFSREFSSVHEDFIQAITKRYGIFTQSELRLVSLLKMNLSSKEIANILRISDEGIKKARYRLRKKMNLAKGEDLQGVILAL